MLLARSRGGVPGQPGCARLVWSARTRAALLVTSPPSGLRRQARRSARFPAQQREQEGQGLVHEQAPVLRGPASSCGRCYVWILSSPTLHSLVDRLAGSVAAASVQMALRRSTPRVDASPQGEDAPSMPFEMLERNWRRVASTHTLQVGRHCGERRSWRSGGALHRRPANRACLPALFHSCSRTCWMRMTPASNSGPPVYVA